MILSFINSIYSQCARLQFFSLVRVSSLYKKYAVDKFIQVCSYTCRVLSKNRNTLLSIFSLLKIKQLKTRCHINLNVFCSTVFSRSLQRFLKHLFALIHKHTQDTQSTYTHSIASFSHQCDCRCSCFSKFNHIFH